MTIQNNLAEIRAALSTLSLLHAQGELDRADVLAAVNFVEQRCDEIANILAPDTPFGMATLPILTLRDVAAQANIRREAGKRHLRVVANEGDAA